MEVLRITPRGYCHGVVDAFRIAKRVRESTGGPVHMLGQLVHNTHATDDLQRQGITLVDPPKTPLRADSVIMQEKWESLATLQAHLAAPHMNDFRAKVKDLIKNVKVEVFQTV